MCPLIAIYRAFTYDLAVIIDVIRVALAPAQRTQVLHPRRARPQKSVVGNKTSKGATKSHNLTAVVDAKSYAAISAW